MDPQELIQMLMAGGDVPPLPMMPSGPLQGPGTPNSNFWIRDQSGKPIDRMPPIKTYPEDYGKKIGEADPQEAIRVLMASNEPRDLDKRTPPPLPMVSPTHSIAPHNPNPPGGGPYNLEPGKRIGEADPQELIRQLMAQG